MQGTLPAGFCKISTLFCRLQWQGSFFLEVPAKGAFCFAVRGGKRQFSLAETCQPVHFSTPRFLAAQRSAVSSRREEIAILRWRVNTQGSADPFGIPWVPGMQCLTNEIIFCGFRKHSLSGLQLQTGLQFVQRSDCRAADLAVFAAARHFCSAKILAGGLRWGWGPRRSRE